MPAIKTMKKKLLILTGPQGSGNHLWSKIFSEDPSVIGWKELTRRYWVPHGDEPFVNIWKNPKLFSSIKWQDGLYLTSVSCPYITQGGPTLPEDQSWEIPIYEEFIREARESGFETQLVIIGRDKHILEYQQTRVRKQHTLPIFLEIVEHTLKKYEPFFISTEQLYLYERVYLDHISKMLNWPISISEEKLKYILKDDTNKKYLAPVNEYWLDLVMANTRSKKNNPYVYKGD
jgi:hypothetical protein